MKLKKTVYLALIISIGIGYGNSEAANLVSWGDYDFSSIQYDSRIRLSPDITNENFESTEVGVDRNADGVVDPLEESAFYLKGETLPFYLGNLHNRFDISRSLLYLGVSGAVGSFVLEGETVLGGDGIAANDPDVFLPFPDVQDSLDRIFLFSIDQVIQDREPNDSPIGENSPVLLTLSNVESADPDLRFFLGAYGAISSGTLNSFTPLNSTILFDPFSQEDAVPADNGEPQSAPVPEPFTLMMVGSGVVFLLKERRKYERAADL